MFLKMELFGFIVHVKHTEERYHNFTFGQINTIWWQISINISHSVIHLFFYEISVCHPHLINIIILVNAYVMFRFSNTKVNRVNVAKNEIPHN